MQASLDRRVSLSAVLDGVAYGGKRGFGDRRSSRMRSKNERSLEALEGILELVYVDLGRATRQLP